MTSLSHRGFKAWVSSKGQKLPVYDIKIEGSTIMCWIPSVPDNPFSVAWRKVDPRPIASSGHIFIDGKDVASGVMRPLRKRHVERSAAKISSSRARPFCFTILELTDDELIAPLHDERLREAGTIKLEVSFVKIGTETPIVVADVDNVTVAHEQAKKAGAMITTFADPERIERGKAVSTSPYDPDNRGPQVTFLFKYHQKAMLQARGIIPSEGRKRSRSDWELDDSGIRVEDTDGVIDLESNDEKEDSPSHKRVKRATESPPINFSQASFEPLYDMGDTRSLFNCSSGSRSGRSEDAMSATDEEGRGTDREELPPSSATITRNGRKDVEDD